MVTFIGLKLGSSQNSVLASISEWRQSRILQRMYCGDVTSSNSNLLKCTEWKPESQAYWPMVNGTESTEATTDQERPPFLSLKLSSQSFAAISTRILAANHVVIGNHFQDRSCVTTWLWYFAWLNKLTVKSVGWLRQNIIVT